MRLGDLRAPQSCAPTLGNREQAGRTRRPLMSLLTAASHHPAEIFIQLLGLGVGDSLR